ncbi:GNAT family N-acetyltransferase [Rufibacter sp. XAAS-G3-1]|uniref:GNAT family N-acetyltransferase n=1 Tax=Rufibacter sp. XAAS-G3-1 TaxID=2729134 RepID=UPI0015E6C66E|nr:GNAT family N-acetyltransferase [Rufibacter sp. XAAS-G3-1]
MTFAFAETLPVDRLCTLFNAAFADYVPPMVLMPAILEMKLRRDGTHLAVSPLAVYQNEPAGFILNGIGIWQGQTTAYNGGTGVVPEARGKALTQRLYAFCLPMLKEHGVTQCLLEVIQENTRALGIYERLGFEVPRTFHVFRHSKADLHWHSHAPQEVSFHQVTFLKWPLYQTFWDVEPSWQHHTAAIDRSAAYVQVVEAHVLGECVGYGIVYLTTGAIAQLAVAPAWRRKGVGQALLQQLVSVTPSPVVSVINVDERGESLLTFLRGRKMPELPGQFEMLWQV